MQEVICGFSVQRLGLLFYLWSPVAQSLGICLRTVQCWFTVWNKPWSPERFALAQHWSVSVKGVSHRAGRGVAGVCRCQCEPVCQSAACTFFCFFRLVLSPWNKPPFGQASDPDVWRATDCSLTWYVTSVLSPPWSGVVPAERGAPQSPD